MKGQKTGNRFALEHYSQKIRKKEEHPHGGTMKFLAKRFTAAIVVTTSCTAYSDDPAQTGDAPSQPPVSASQQRSVQTDTSKSPATGAQGNKNKAKPAPPATPGAQEQSAQLPTVRVTAPAVVADDPQAYNVTHTSLATRTDTPILETPLSIQVVPQQVIKDQQVVRIERALQNVSGVFSNNTTFLQSADEFNIRGFRTGGILYRDGFRFDTTGQGKRDPANLEQIEVLKGPASLLYGRIEPGGLINLRTKQPLATPYYSFAQQFGSFDFYRTTLDATGPITQDNTFGYRLNLAYENAGSFRQFVDNERYFVAPVFQWNIAPTTRLSIGLDHTQEWSHPDSVGLVALGDRPAPIPRDRNLGESWSTFNSTQDIVTETFTHEFDDQWKVRQRFNYSNSDSTNNVVFGDVFGYPPDPIQDGIMPRFPGGIDNNQGYAYNTSLDLIGKFKTWELAHTVVMGGDYFYHRTTESLQGVLDDGFSPCQTLDGINIFDPVHTDAGPPDFFAPGCFKQVFNTRTSWYGFYFQDQIELPYDVFVLGGFRYDNATVNNSSLIANSPSEFNEDRVSPRGGVLWKPVSWLSIYGSYVENFGASNQGFGVGGAALPPETAQQWETGIKTELFDGRFIGTFAYFDLTKQNISAPDPRNPDLFSIPIGEANSHGVEVDLAGEVLPGWRIIANYAYTEATVTKGNEFSFPPVGNELANVPKHGASFWSTYEIQSGDLQGLTFGGGAVMRSQRQGDVTNDFQLPGYVTMDLMASYKLKVGPSHVTFQLNAENLLDKNYIASGADFARNRLAVGVPRSFLGMIRVEF
jgi:iron complex outermembrane receptor protein